MPTPTPVTTPDELPILAVVGLLLSHVPPGDASASVVFEPTHTFVTPPMAAGNGFTVKTTVALQPVTGAV